jgi:hypothetical protein
VFALNVSVRTLKVPVLAAMLKLPAPGAVKNTSSLVLFGTALLVQLVAVFQLLSVAPVHVCVAADPLCACDKLAATTVANINALRLLLRITHSPV